MLKKWLLVFALCSQVNPEKIVLVTDGASSQTKLQGPFGVDFAPNGEIFIIEMPGNRLRSGKSDGRDLKTIAGNGEKGFAGDGGLAQSAQLNGPHSIAALPDGDLLIADTWNNRVRRIEAKSNVISTIAGTGERGFSGDGGPATKAQFGNVYCVALDARAENVYLADLDNRRIRKVNLKTGIVQTVAGNGQKGVPNNGAVAIDGPLVDPRAVAVDSKGTIYILERSGNALRAVDAGGRIRTVAGTGEKGFSGDDGDALQATFNGPKHLCIDRDGNVIIADTENHVIRKYIARTGNVVRVAGTGQKGTNGLNGSPLRAELNQPHGVTVDSKGTLYIADSSNDRVLKLVP